MSFANSLQKSVELVTKKVGEEANAELARVAKLVLADAIRTGEGSPNYTKFINGRKNVPEETVRVPGPIIYKFNWLTHVAAFAIEYLRQRWNVLGPGRGGHFVDSYFLLADGKEILPKDAAAYDQIYVTNDKPYSRKAQMGSKGFRVPRGMFEDCRQAIMNHFGRNLMKVELSFITLGGGYILRRRKKKVNATGRSEGQEMRYPAIRITVR